MNKKNICEKTIEKFKKHLMTGERSANTIAKYMHDVRYFQMFLNDEPVSKRRVIEYKKQLEQDYEPTSVNSMLAALNSLFSFLGRHDLRVKQLKIQKRIFQSEDKELTKKDYEKLIRAAKTRKNNRLNLVLQTITSTGIRVSELEFVSVKSVMSGHCEVSCKGKIRTIFLHNTLRKLLLEYIKENGITEGPVFVTKTGKPLNRSNIWREMKELCKYADVCPDKVFPHNLRHLFARSFNNLDDNIVKLANVLGHTNIDTTRIYTLTSGREYAKQISSLGLVFV